MTPTFQGKTAAEVAEQLGRYIREKLAEGAPMGEAVAIVMRTPNGFVGACGSREGLLAQLAGMDPKVARDVRRDLTPRPGYFPLIALDPIDGSHGVEWIGPFPNAAGGSA